ncbi:DEKNAAC101343 [Brettanomyces naardenensis]|uniref:DEKNAAC101343 n=1 Tax=Brettanomyces naardenensis TaxID=13370 RepID=A0A448YHP1_BRENA|nr:DEKNAAC101343 [Brettanomyces naardenensis]
MSTHQNTSTQDVLTTIAYNAVVCGAMVGAFLLLRLRFKRIYEPKSNFEIVPLQDRPTKLPRTPWGWLLAVLTIPPKATIQESGIDGYLFIRYLFVFSCLFVGGITTWAILLPINATDGKGEYGLDQLGISNVGSTGRYYAHAVVSWIFYGFTMFVIYRELVFYTNLRNAALVSGAYAGKLSARTVIFQTVADEYLDKRRISKMFDGVEKVWIARAQKKLEKKVAERASLCLKLENALCTLLRKAVKAKRKADGAGETIEPADEIVCYVPQRKRPTMRKRPIFGQKIDIIEYCREEIPKLNEEIAEMQQNCGTANPLNSVAVEFSSQFAAQTAFQQAVYDQPMKFVPRQIGVEPQDVFWPNMRMFWWERMARQLSADVAISALVVFWAIPSAFVGVISNLTYITNKVPWLKFIYNLPPALLGLITSLLPTILMTLLMMVLPLLIHTLARISGAVTLQSIEYYTQQAYFAFQVIQVFLVTTVASSVTSVITQIMENPTSVMSLLSSNLPKCSNFFISYVLFQGFSIASGSLLQVVPLILFYILGKMFDNTPRKKWARFSGLGGYAWGTTFPIYTNLAVITLAYAIISPIILLFAAASFLMLYVCYQNNANYVVGKSADGLGKYYARALFQTMTGIYLGEICLLGIFAVSEAWGPLILEAIFLFFTAFCHLQMNDAFDKLLRVIPNTVMKPLDGKSDTVSWRSSKSHGRSPFTDHLVDVPLLIDQVDYKRSKTDANFLVRFFQPNTYLSYAQVKQYIPETFRNIPEEKEEWRKHAYDYKVVSAKCPKVWIPRDLMGLSRIEINRFKGIVDIVDENATFDKKGRAIWTGPPPQEDQLRKEVEKKEDNEEDVTSADTTATNPFSNSKYV